MALKEEEDDDDSSDDKDALFSFFSLLFFETFYCKTSKKRQSIVERVLHYCNFKENTERF
ncbi:hypothetical protein E2C01_086462 [Portunus trituberculatus]|uniref:Uncharacterized protein n=1 Tax=Portunus trituberculatus TaxID=210409 RepID=A0A5B7JBJ3_PORTR|nr:hypothetical protein [Portunus trituberculatus]